MYLPVSKPHLIQKHSSMNNDDFSNHIIDIQTQMAFQEQTIEQLNEVLINQQKQIDALQRKLKVLDEKIEQESQHWGQPQSPIDEKPPHY